MRIKVEFIQDKTGKLLFSANVNTEFGLKSVMESIQKSNGGLIQEEDSCIIKSTFQNKKDVFVNFEILS